MKTIDEAAKAANGYGYPNFNGEKHDAFNDGFKSGVEFAQRWYSVEEELPEMYEDVLIKTDEGVIRLTHRDTYANGMLKWWLVLHSIKVTHWRPIELK